MTYLSNEYRYRDLMLSFIQGALCVAEFERKFIDQWRSDRDAEWVSIKSGAVLNAADYKLGQILDQAFTAVDCYTENLQNAIDISEEQLRSEIRALFNARCVDK
jgi:hypothetical protein